MAPVSLRDRLKARHFGAADAPAEVSPLAAVAPQPSFKLTITRSATDAKRPSGFIQGDGPTCARKMADALVVTPHKGEVSLFSAGVLRDDLPEHESVSTQAALKGVQLLVVDYDHEDQAAIERAQERLAASGWVYLMYPTHSWTRPAPRWRVVVFLACPVAVERYATLWGALGDYLGARGDQAAKKPAQRYYLPSRPPGDAANWPDAITGGTALLDPDQLDLNIEKAQAQLAPAVGINSDILTRPPRRDRRDRDAGLMADQCPAMGGFIRQGKLPLEPVWRSMAGALGYCTGGLEIFREASKRADPSTSDAAIERKFEGWDGPPPRCGFAPECDGCKHRGNISSPVQLGDASNDTAPEKSTGDATLAIEQGLRDQGITTILDQNEQLCLVVPSESAGRNVLTVLNAASQAAGDAIIARLSPRGRPPTERQIDLAKAKMRHEARERGETTNVALRADSSDTVIHLDLGPGRIAQINKNGVTVVDDKSQGVPLFARGSGIGVLPDPAPFTNPSEALRFLLRTLQSQFGLEGSQALLVIVAMVEYMRTTTPHPIMEILGVAGCGKSSLFDFIVRTLDPASDGGRVTVGTSSADIAAAAQQRYVLGLDNVGKLDRGASDLMCVISTGGTLAVRQLYTNDETKKLKLHRPLVLTAVYAACVAPDLQTRTLRIELPARQGGYKAESELRAELGALQPQVLGALFCLASGALGKLPEVRARGAWGHRLVDFDQLGEAITSAAGLPEGRFIKAVTEMRERMARRSASGDPFLIEVLAALRKLARTPTHTTQPTTGDAVRATPALTVFIYQGRVEVVSRVGAFLALLPRPLVAYGRDQAMPSTERALTDALRRVQPLLKGLGISLTEVAHGSRGLLRFEFELEALDEV